MVDPLGRSSRLPSLTGLRFVAASLVLLCHCGITLLPRVAPEREFEIALFYAAGAVGVSFFFILSGFVLTWVATDSDTKLLFWRRRVVKIFPNHLVTFAAAVALMLLTGAAVTFGNTVPVALLAHAWIPDQGVLLNFFINTPSWSLACELFFYLSFPWLLALIRRIRPERLWACFAAVTAAIFAVPAVAGLLPAGERIYGSGEPWLGGWFMTFFPPARALEFVLGILLARIVISGRWIRVPLTVAVPLAIGGCLLSAWLPDRFGEVAVTVMPLAFVIAAAATADIGRHGTVFGGRTMVRLGEISYALYLVHWLVIAYGPIGRSDPQWGQSWGTTATVPEALLQASVTIVVSLVLAWLLYTLVERPAMRRWSRPAHRPGSSSAEVPAAVAGRPVS